MEKIVEQPAEELLSMAKELLNDIKSSRRGDDLKEMLQNLKSRRAV